MSDVDYAKYHQEWCGYSSHLECCERDKNGGVDFWCDCGGGKIAALVASAKEVVAVFNPGLEHTPGENAALDDLVMAVKDLDASL